MTRSHVIAIVLSLLGLFICGLPLALFGYVVGVPFIRDWQVQRSITVIDGAQYLFDDTRQVTGNYKQKSFYYWTARETLEVATFYERYTITPFIEVNSDNAWWLISSWKESEITENPVRLQVYLPSDLCDYQNVFNCMSVVLFDARQISTVSTLKSIYSTPQNQIELLPNSGTLIVFSYSIPDFF